jgi:hypothetical protein
MAKVITTMSAQTFLTLSQIAIALGLIISALGGYGAYHFQKIVETEKEGTARPTIDLCHRGISVREVGPEKLYFDIPYCAGKDANAYNVKLEPAVILRVEDGFRVLSGFGDSFPDGITLSYETGKSMSFSLHPVGNAALTDMFIGVRGTYTNQNGSSMYHVFDVFKRNAITGQWVRTLGDEDRRARAFFNSIRR